MPETSEIAKAIKNVAKFGSDAISLADKLGSFIGKILQGPANEISCMITDMLRFVRWQRTLLMCDKVNKILDKRGIKDTRAVHPKLALPILEESSLEDDESLQELWANLLANAMDGNYKEEIRYAYIDIIKNLTSLDAHLLSILYATLQKHGKLAPEDVWRIRFLKQSICENLNICADQYLLSINNLMRARLVEPGVMPLKLAANAGSGISFSTDSKDIDLSHYKGTDEVTMTYLGIKFVEATHSIG